MHRNTWLRILEFAVAGVLMDLVENMVVFRAAAGRALAFDEVWIAVLVIIPFAAMTEIVIDHPRFWHRLLGLKGRHKFDNLDLSK